MSLESEIKAQKIKANAVQSMLAQPGWTIIEEELIADTHLLTSKLIDETDPNKVRVLQAELRALKKLLNKVTHYASIKPSKSSVVLTSEKKY